MLPDSISEEKSKIDWKMEDLQAGPFWCRLFWGCILSSLHQNGPVVDLPFFDHFLNFSLEMESGNISPPLIEFQLKNSKFFKNFDHSNVHTTLSYLLLKIKILIPVKIIGLRSHLKVFTGIKKKNTKKIFWCRRKFVFRAFLKTFFPPSNFTNDLTFDHVIEIA